MQGGTAPGRVAITISEQGSVVADNGDHNGVVDEAAQNGAVNLSEKHDTRGDFDWSNELAPGDGTKDDKEALTIFAHLEVIAQVDRVKDDIVRPSGKVHVANGATRKHKARQHLGQVVGGNTVTPARIEEGTL